MRQFLATNHPAGPARSPSKHASFLRELLRAPWSRIAVGRSPRAGAARHLRAARSCEGHRRIDGATSSLLQRPLVRPFFVRMVDKFSCGRPEMPFAEKHHSVQAFGLGGLNEPFNKRI
jgi:hypothetical protein